MTMITEAKENKLQLDLVKPVHERAFVAQVLASYAEYMETVQYPEVPERFSGNENFFEHFYPAYLIICDSVKIGLFPDSMNRHLNAEEMDELDRVLCEDFVSIELDVVTDILQVLDMFKLFYITTEWDYIHYFSEMTIEKIAIHCPIQEVW